jgi:drug/metabolite transporter (DMT)-like permease
MLGVSLQIYPTWFVAYYMAIAALFYTSLTTSAIMKTSMSLFCYVFSIALLGEKLRASKAASIFLCIAGARCPGRQRLQAWLGDS